MDLSWFKPRGYAHLDAPIGQAFAKRVADADFVAKHPWLPLIHYTKLIKRYKAKEGRTVFKERPIMYASHRDACILSKYAWDLGASLDRYYEDHGLDRHVIAYRKLGRSNYDFSADAFAFASAHPKCVVLCFDITGFFDHIDHKILKDRLKCVLETPELTSDWYAVFRHVTQFKLIERADLAAHPTIGPRLALGLREPLATIAKIVSEGIPIKTNKEKFGIPQGTPISSVLSNLYMIDVDQKMVEACGKRGALYQRYSDDVLIICSLEDETTISSAFDSLVKNHLLEIKPEKTERTIFDPQVPQAFQYLGFNISPQGAVIRPASLARQWRKAKRSILQARLAGAIAMAEGKATKIFTKNLRRRFSPVGARNFSSYARRSAKAFGSKKIVRQVLRLERMIDTALHNLNGSTDTPPPSNK